MRRGGLQGVDFELDGYALTSDTLGEGIATVTVSGGTIRSSATPSELPLGETLRSILEEDFDVEIPTTTETETDSIGDFTLVAVREEDGGT